MKEAQDGQYNPQVLTEPQMDREKFKKACQIEKSLRIDV